jgi:hypothetical protein
LFFQLVGFVVHIRAHRIRDRDSGKQAGQGGSGPESGLGGAVGKDRAGKCGRAQREGRGVRLGRGSVSADR